MYEALVQNEVLQRLRVLLKDPCIVDVRLEPSVDQAMYDAVVEFVDHDDPPRVVPPTVRVQHVVRVLDLVEAQGDQEWEALAKKVALAIRG